MGVKNDMTFGQFLEFKIFEFCLDLIWFCSVDYCHIWQIDDDVAPENCGQNWVIQTLIKPQIVFVTPMIFLELHISTKIKWKNCYTVFFVWFNVFLSNSDLTSDEWIWRRDRVQSCIVSYIVSEVDSFITY